MGGSQVKERARIPVPPPASVHAIRELLQIPTDREHHTLDKTLKGFLRAANMKGLEYRLRLAGMYI